MAGEIPWDAHLFYVEGPQWQSWPPKVTIEAGWHTCGRAADEFETGGFVLSIPPTASSGLGSQPRAVSDWTTLIDCPVQGSVAFSAQAVGTDSAEMPGDLPTLYVELPSGYADTAIERTIAVTVPYDVVVVDSSGAVVDRTVVEEALASASAVRIEARDIGGSLWAKRIQLMEP